MVQTESNKCCVNKMAVEFKVMLWIVPNKWCDLLVALMPLECGRVQTYENFKSVLLGEKVCAGHVTFR
jgi:hypothetical protein